MKKNTPKSTGITGSAVTALTSTPSKAVSSSKSDDAIASPSNQPTVTSSDASTDKTNSPSFPPLEKKENYNLWCVRMRVFLNRHNMWNPDTQSPKDSAAAVDHILSVLSDKLVETVVESTSLTASSIWNYLAKICVTTDLSSQTAAISSLVDFKYEKSTMLENHTHLLGIIRTLKTCFGSDSITFDQLATIFALFNLPPCYHSLRTTLEEVKSEKLVLEELFKSLYREEAQQPTAVRRTNSCPHGRSAPKCWTCTPSSRPVCDYCKNLGTNRYFHTTGSKSCSKSSSTSEARRAKSDKSVTFTVDSGATQSILRNKDSLSSYTEVHHPIKIADGFIVYATENGTLSTENLNLSNILVCKQMTENLLSVSQLDDQGLATLFVNGKVFIGTNATINNILHEGARIGSSYNLTLNLHDEAKRIDTTHLKFNHLNNQDLRNLINHNMVLGIDKSHSTACNCEGCLVGKARKGVSPKTANRHATQPGKLFHSDICGPITPASSGGFRYFLTFTDDYSKFMFVSLLKSKTEAFAKFQELDALIYNTFGYHINTFRSDNGTEFRNHNFDEYCCAYGITQEFTTPHCPNQNGVSERANLTIMNPVRAMLHTSPLEQIYWDEAVLNVVHTRNRSPSANDSTKTCYELYYGYKPDVSHLQVFGSTCYAITTPYQRRISGNFKLADRAEKCTFLGYSTNSKSYRLLTVAHDIKIARYEDTRFLKPDLHSLNPRVSPCELSKSTSSEANVDFFNGRISHQSHAPRPTATSVTIQDESTEIPPTDSTDSTIIPTNEATLSVTDNSMVNETSESSEYNQTQSPSTLPDVSLNLPDVSTEHPRLTLIDPTAGIYKHPILGKVELQPITTPASKAIDQPPLNSKRISRPPSRYSSALRANTMDITGTEICMLKPSDKAKILGHTWYKCFDTKANRIQTEHVPNSYEDIENMADSSKWILATDEEINSLVENNTWELVPLPPNRRALKNKWVFRIKRDADGNITRYKARLCICGYSQQHGIDYDEIYSPVVRNESVRILLSLIASRKMHAHQMDVVCAFLNGRLKEEIYMQQPPGYEDPNNPNCVCRLLTNLYGLKQAPRVWHSTIDPYLQSLGYKALDADPCIYFKYDNNHLSLIALYVDDLVISADREQDLLLTKAKLCEKFKMTDEGKLEYLLGMKIERNQEKQEILISSESKINDLLKDFNMHNCIPISTPMEANTLSKQDSPQTGSEEWLKMQNVPYRQCVGRLLHLMRTTRPDIAYSVSVVSRFMNNPGQKHWNAVKRILRYLKGTKHYVLKLSPDSLSTRIQFLKSDNSPTITGFTDADWAGDIDNARSTSGYAFYLGNSLISWASKTQPETATSTTHAEYIAAYQATIECIWTRSFLSQLGLLENQPTVLYCDNDAALKIASYPMVTPRSKHFNTKYHYIREQISSGALALTFCKGKENTADIFTKPLPKTKFETFRSDLGLTLSDTMEHVKIT
jgi:transposase InsO family protein